MGRLERAIAGVLLVLFALTVIGCTKSARYRPTRMSDNPIIPISEADRPYPGKITYYLARLEQEKDGTVYLDADIFNGQARGYSLFSAIITLIGKDGERKQFRQAMGPLREATTERLVLSIRKVQFEVDRVQIGVQLFGAS